LPYIIVVFIQMRFAPPTPPLLPYTTLFRSYERGLSMTTTQDFPDTSKTIARSSIDSADTSKLQARPNVAEAWHQTMGFASRALKKMRRQPEQFADVAIQPILFTMMFGYIFGGAISGDVADYLPIM